MQTAEHHRFSCPTAPLLEVGIWRDIAPGETPPSPAARGPSLPASCRGGRRNTALMPSHIKHWGMWETFFKALRLIFTFFWRGTGKAAEVCYYWLSRCLETSFRNCIYPSCIHVNLDNQFIGLRAPQLFSFLASIQTRSRAHTTQRSVCKCQKYQNNLASYIQLLDVLPHRCANAAVTACLGGRVGCLGTQSSWLLSQLALIKRQLWAVCSGTDGRFASCLLRMEQQKMRGPEEDAFLLENASWPPKGGEMVV